MSKAKKTSSKTERLTRINPNPNRLIKWKTRPSKIPTNKNQNKMDTNSITIIANNPRPLNKNPRLRPLISTKKHRSIPQPENPNSKTPSVNLKSCLPMTRKSFKSSNNRPSNAQPLSWKEKNKK